MSQTKVQAGGIDSDAVVSANIANSSVTPAKLSTGAPTWNNTAGAPGSPAGKLTTTGAFEVANKSYVKLGDAYVSSGEYFDTTGSSNTGRLAQFGTNVYLVGGGVAQPPFPATINWQCDGRGPGGMYQIYASSSTNQVAHYWWKHNGVTGGSPTFTNLMVLDNSGILQTLQGYRGRQGSEGGTSNVFNIYWDGSGAQLWIDNAYVGNISLVSDYRIKKNIQTQTSSAIERVSKLRPITYEYQNYGELFKEDGVQREGFIAHELAEVIPSAVEGEKDAPNQIQSLRLDALVSVLTKALQEAIGRIETLEAEVAELKNLK
jgi:hypothetical protein